MFGAPARADATKYPDNMDAFPAPCYDPHAPADGGWGGLCSGWYGPDNLEVVDSVRVPAHLPAGKYVVQWSAQQVSSLTLLSTSGPVAIIA